MSVDKGHNTLDLFFEKQRRRVLADLYPTHRMRQKRAERDAAGDDLGFVCTELSDMADSVTVRR